MTHRKHKTFHAHDMYQWDAHPQRGKVLLEPCLYLLLDAIPVMATWLTGILRTGNDFLKSVESKSLFHSVHKYVFFKEMVNIFKKSITLYF